MFENNKNLKPRKKSYYPFSKNYPGRRTGTAYAIGESRTRRKKERGNTVAYAIFLAVAFVVVFLSASVIFMLSGRPLSHGTTNVSAEDGQWKAVYITADELAGGIAFDLFQNTLAESDASAVMLDFKNADGMLCAAAEGGTSAEIGAAAHTVSGAAETVQRLKASGYKIIARIYCFQDPIAAAMLPNAAVTEADGVTVWLDESARNGGEPWLNPYAQNAQGYLLQVIREAVDFGADNILLCSVSFPTGRYTDRAFFPGEAESLYSRNAVLHDFIEQAELVTGDVPLTVSMPLSAALYGDSARFGGGIFDSAAAFAAVDYDRTALSQGAALGTVTYTADLPSEQLISGTAAQISEKLSENYRTKSVIPLIYSKEDIVFLKNAGIQNYIWIPEKDT